MIDARQITNLHQATVALWHRQEVANPYEGFQFVVCEQHKFNYLLWHEEDIARSPDVSDTKIAAVKRAIDKYNQQRNDWIEKIDEFVKRELDRRNVAVLPGARMNTETPGATIDRLSIISLRLYHMREQTERLDASAEHLASTRHKLSVLEVQHHDLANSLGELLSDILSGRKRLKIYRQFKMYNDPTLNPYLYQAQPRKAG